MITETRTFVGEPGTPIGEGWAGFRLDKRYELYVQHVGDDMLTVLLAPPERVMPGSGLVLTSEQFEKWFKK